MRLKDLWKDLVDGVDTASSKPVNDIAHAVIKMEEENENKEDISIEIDTEMSDESENPVQNKVIKFYVDDKVGNIENALDNIISIQETLIGGGSV